MKKLGKQLGKLKKMNGVYPIIIGVLALIIIAILATPRLGKETLITTTQPPIITTTLAEQQKQVCDPCFKYFNYSGYIEGALTFKNGGERIQVSAVQGGKFFGKTTFDPGEYIIITGIPKTGSADIHIRYIVLDSGETHLDNATVHN
ncbi:hypothetical protein A3K63_03490 [Candidatus Micrarchaeota archaeon RBG_16_49_10]|nr:MAG: hypothetical protein A3K63_03490 [Candidatus Micrarchaeota archaeon RBG_16_49_10]